jgi:hypothetical protein
MRRFRRFGVTEAELDTLLATQKGRCAICKSATPYGSGDWAIDHDHATGQVRGLLCSKCNLALGLLSDDPKVIAAALRYVNRHRQMQLFGAAGPVEDPGGGTKEGYPHVRPQAAGHAGRDRGPAVAARGQAVG